MKSSVLIFKKGFSGTHYGHHVREWIRSLPREDRSGLPTDVDPKVFYLNENWNTSINAPVFAVVFHKSLDEFSYSELLRMREVIRQAPHWRYT